MDSVVAAAMAKWPNVPHCYGWLGLDSRGRWFMRDERSQRAGPFAGPHGTGHPAAKGSLLQHDKLIAFIHRNYLADASGQWFFQNGPQRVYVELEVSPWIWRLAPDGVVSTHCGRKAGEIMESLLDEQGRLFLHTSVGLGLVHTADMVLAAEQLERGAWPPPQAVNAGELPELGGFVLSPAMAQERTQSARP